MQKSNFFMSDENKLTQFMWVGFEVVVSILTGVATWFWLRNFLHSSLPFPCGTSVNYVLIDCGWTEQQAWDTLGRPLFDVYSVPFSLFLAVSSIFFIKSIRKDVRHFSRIGNFALSFPLFGFLSFFLISVLSLPLQFIGLILSIRANTISEKVKYYKWDWVSFPYNLLWFFIIWLFMNQFLGLYGD